MKKRVNDIVGLRKVTNEDIAALEHKPKPRPPSPKRFPPDVRSAASPQRPLPVRTQLGSPMFLPRESPRVMVRSPYPRPMAVPPGRPHPGPGQMASPMRQYYNRPDLNSTVVSSQVPSPVRLAHSASPVQPGRHGGQSHT